MSLLSTSKSNLLLLLTALLFLALNLVFALYMNFGIGQEHPKMAPGGCIGGVKCPSFHNKSV